MKIILTLPDSATARVGMPDANTLAIDVAVENDAPQPTTDPRNQTDFLLNLLTQCGYLSRAQVDDPARLTACVRTTIVGQPFDATIAAVKDVFWHAWNAYTSADSTFDEFVSAPQCPTDAECFQILMLLSAAAPTA